MEENYSLILAFDDDSISFCNGWELGVIWQQMKFNQVIEGCYHTENVNMLRKMAESNKYSIKAVISEVPEWTYILLEPYRKGIEKFSVIKGGGDDL